MRIRFRCGTVSGQWRERRSTSNTLEGLAQELDILDICRDLVGGQHRQRVGLGDAPVAETMRVSTP